MYGAYCSTSHPTPERFSEVIVANAADKVHLGTPSELGFVVPASSQVVSSLPGALFADSGSSLSTRTVPNATTPTASQLSCFLIRKVSVGPNLAASSSLSPNPTVVKPASSISIARFFFDTPVIPLPDSPADIFSAPQPMPPALTPAVGSAIQIFYDGLVCREVEFSCLDEAFINCEAQLQSLKEQRKAWSVPEMHRGQRRTLRVRVGGPGIKNLHVTTNSNDFSGFCRQRNVRQ